MRLRALARMGSQGVELVIDESANSAETLLMPPPGTFRPAGRARTGNARNRQRPVLALQPRLPGCTHAAQGTGVGARWLPRRPGLWRAGAADPGLEQEAQTEYARSYATSLGLMRQAAQIAADAGIILGVENVRTSLLGSPGEYAGDPTRRPITRLSRPTSISGMA